MKKTLKVIGICFLAAIVLNIAWQFKISLGLAPEHILKSSIFASRYPLNYLAGGIASALPQLIICAFIAYASRFPWLAAFLTTLLCFATEYHAVRETGFSIKDANLMAITKSIPDFIFYWLFSFFLNKVAPRKTKQKEEEEKKDNNI